jgi:hypothetical protein
MSTTKSLHELTAEDNQGHTIDFSQLKGKVGTLIAAGHERSIISTFTNFIICATVVAGGAHRECGLQVRLHASVQGAAGPL